MDAILNPKKRSNKTLRVSRLTEHPLPPYSYVPRMHPHPVSDPVGHSYGIAGDTIDPTDELAIRSGHDWAIDLFNYGYYWESHEAWESIWHAFGGTGRQANFVKGLIKLAAAGVKAREGRAVGVKRHVGRAIEIVDESANADAGRSDSCMGLSYAWLRAQVQLIFDQPEAFVEDSHCDVMSVFPFALVPEHPTS